MPRYRWYSDGRTQIHCKTCDLFVNKECRKNAPVVRFHAGYRNSTLFPMPKPSQWCGEWEDGTKGRIK